MKRSTIIILLSLSIISMNVLSADATTYTVNQLTDNDYHDGINYFYGLWPHMNANGQAVWIGRYVTINDDNQEIFFFNGTSVIRLTTNAIIDTHPDINASGQVVWMGLSGNFQIFFYDGTSVEQITSDTTINNWYPELNDNEEIAWQGNGEIYLYSGGTLYRLTEDGYYDGDPQINNSGQVVWHKDDGNDYEIFLFDGTDVIQLTDNDYDDRWPQINDTGYVVWQGGNNNSPSDIFLYDGTNVENISNSPEDNDAWPRINNMNQVVWQGGGNISPTDIFLYDGTNVENISNSPTANDYFPGINNSGQVVWEESPGEVMLYDGTSVTNISNDPTKLNQAPQIDDSGRVLWMKHDGTDWEIYLATPNSGQTPTGSDVPVTPVDPDPVVPTTSITVTFENVTEAGETSVSSSGTGTPPPSGFKVGNPPVYFEISTTAVADPPFEVCINYTGISFGNEKNVRLFHQTAGGNWEDVTTSVDTGNNIVCGTVNDLSPFVMGEPTIVCPPDPVSVQAGTNTCSYSLSYTPPIGTTIAWDWGDGNTSVGAIQETPLQITGSHTYLDPGVYVVRLDVSEGSDIWSDSYHYVVVYDPYGGFVTGGGWINSPSGAYTPAPTLAGKASFGFVSKYKKGATVPVGNTEFQFHVADFTFHSSDYEWLVVAGARAQFKGTGTVNGTGNYGFILSAIDGALPGGGGTDKFRIKIRDLSNDAIVFDNQNGADEGADPNMEIGGGSIVIHK